MKIPVFILIIALMTGCASGKKAKEMARSRSQSGRETAQTAGRPPASTPASSAPDWKVVSINSRYLHKDSSTIRVYMNVITQKGLNYASVDDLMSRFMLNYVLYPDYNNRERLGYGNVILTKENVVKQGTADGALTVFFDVARPKNAPIGVMLAEFVDANNGRKVLHDLPIRFRSTRLSDHYALFNPKTGFPQLKNYATVDDTVIIRDVMGTSRPLTMIRYRHEFDPASSPMNTTPKAVAKSLNVDSTLTITTNQPFVLTAEGLYLMMADTNDAYGIGLVIADKRFPKMTRPEKLIKPVMYMSTTQEINELTKGESAKKALDRYWLSLMAGNQEVARRTIRAYYSRVEEANRLFTSFKEGWKTDKGMIYIVLGPPDRVQRSRDREVWIYNQRANVSEINFTFNRKPNQFVEDHYELVRYMEYQPVWYPVVEAWRTGAIRE
ncbi:GWxTD domain-containing protein [Tellurirhabdus bombi]|uniref:GWxTD domain-containing protein n=1 Tax=Tellurirhabdus bombi TaxID=2907205 RepID=UPI001F1F56FC|nr:GWxTD domain-containing protein [Tellurirhabdus bombi]